MNLDEFEGHTPGPWKWSEEQLSEYVPQSKALLCVFEGEEMEVIDMWLRWIGNDANKALIAAAPDLLAEVKRLRDLHILACDYLQSISDGTLPDNEWPHIHAMIRGDDE